MEGNSPHPLTMISYTTERKNYWPYILRQWIIIAMIYAVCIILMKLFLSDFKNAYYWICAGVSGLGMVRWLDKEWIQDISIDEQAKTITHHYRSPLNGEGEKIHILRDVQLYVKTSTQNGKPAIRSLTLYKQRRRVLVLQTREDGFTPETLEAIRQQLIRLGVQQ
ncbi:hypothetical protein [Paraflavitalea sp. CAU 1676]|uniref:hypothetical protein n=1 Tax=Paraflavitalea sp. CAU 1676 TaxID=3032598 RepID=UPI0023D9B8A7|nr:hypothetical protein [Paraflavitalea sp. CAU 1676]MDF2188823.1 hypothetical protein [Paraflavitalea sp. CAU 1676]